MEGNFLTLEDGIYRVVVYNIKNRIAKIYSTDEEISRNTAVSYIPDSISEDFD